MYASVPSWWNRGIPQCISTHNAWGPNIFPFSLSFNTTPLAFCTYCIIFHIISHIVHHSYHIVSRSSVLISYIILTGLYFMTFIVISCHSYHTITYCITIYHIINMSIYHISRTITYFISYDNMYISVIHMSYHYHIIS